MSVIVQQRARVLKAISRHIEFLDKDKYVPADYELDKVARLILELPERPTDSQPYLGWLVAPELKQKMGFDPIDFVNLVRFEANKKLHWTPNSEAVKYTRTFEKVGLRGRFPWCAAFVHWCLNSHQVYVPLFCAEYPGYTYALCESWQKMAQVRGWYSDNNGNNKPQAGDLVLFDWGQRNIHEPDTDWEDHIGVYLEEIDSRSFWCAEGNSHNKSGLFKRNYASVQGYVRIPVGTKQI
jgi:hypothetical protein